MCGKSTESRTRCTRELEGSTLTNLKLLQLLPNSICDSVSSLFGAAERPKLGPTFSRPFGATAGQRSHAGLRASASAQQLTSSLTSSSSMSKMSFKSSTPLYSFQPTEGSTEAASPR